VSRRSLGIRGRLALATGALVLAIFSLLIGGLYWGTLEYLEESVDDRVEAELQELVGQHANRGGDALVREIERRSALPSHRLDAYVFAASSRQRIAGNLASWPEQIATLDEVRTVTLVERTTEVSVVRQIRAEARRLADGRLLLVGQDVTQQLAFARVLRVAALGALAAALLLAIGGGIAIGRNLLDRVVRMNRTILDILKGRSNARVEVSGRGDEFDELAEHFNRLHDENKRLIEQVRGVTDDIAHDLRTPLARMRGHIESALAAPPDAARSEAVLRELQGEVERLLDTFSALLQIALIESGTIRERMQPVELEPVVRGAVDLYGPLAEEAGLEIVTELEPELRVLGHRQLLAQALANLLDNAIKYANGSGPITLRTSRSDAGIELRVSDRGPGIPAAARDRVLRRFARLDAARHRPGTGLGLSFVAAVAELHGADLALGGADPGLCVRLVFPALAPSEGEHA